MNAIDLMMSYICLICLPHYYHVDSHSCWVKVARCPHGFESRRGRVFSTLFFGCLGSTHTSWGINEKLLEWAASSGGIMRKRGKALYVRGKMMETKSFVLTCYPQKLRQIITGAKHIYVFIVLFYFTVILWNYWRCKHPPWKR